MERHLCGDERGGCDGDGTHAIGAHWPCDVLDILLAEILERIRKLVANLVAHDTRDADAARLSQCLQPRSNVDAITVDVVAITDNVAEVDPDTEDDPLVLRGLSIAIDHSPLQLDGAADRVDDAGEFCQYAVAGCLYCRRRQMTAPIRCSTCGNQGTPVRIFCCQIAS